MKTYQDLAKLVLRYEKRLGEQTFLLYEIETRFGLIEKLATNQEEIRKDNYDRTSDNIYSLWETEYKRLLRKRGLFN